MENEERREQPFIIIPFLPPSSNHIYSTGRNGIRFLTKEAKKFKTETISLIQREKLSVISKFDPQGIYRVWYAFFFPKEELVNKTWGEGKKDSATNRYKRMDVENRLKLVTDALATAIGIDDSQFFEGGHTKLCSSLTSEKEQIHIFINQASPDKFGL